MVRCHTSSMLRKRETILYSLATDGSCTLINDETGEVFTDRHLTEINIEWLDTLLSWYNDCCNEQGLNTQNE